LNLWSRRMAGRATVPKVVYCGFQWINSRQCRFAPLVRCTSMSLCSKSTSVHATPILDSGVLPSRIRNRKKKVFGFIAGFMAGICLGLAITAISSKTFDTEVFPGEALLVFIAALGFSVTIHEFGHLLAGWIIGFRFSFVSVGPFWLRLEHGILKVRFRREMPALGYAGMHVNGARKLRRRLLIYIAAGPAANLFSALLILLARRAPSLTHDFGSSVAVDVGIISIVLFVLSLLPLGSSSSSDGSRIAMLLSSRERSRRFISILAIGGQQRNGVRPKNWRQSWLRAASSLHDNSVDEFSGNWLAYISANGRKDAHIAADHLERCLELTPLLQHSKRDQAAHEAAVFSAWFRRNSKLAENWASRIRKPKLATPLNRIRLGVALSCAHGDFVVADEKWKEGFTFIENLPRNLSQEQLKESWLEWQAEINQRQRESPLAETNSTRDPVPAM
jgi:Zn-dependent protease